MARTVLVVDDDPLVLEVTAAMLEDLGCDVVSVTEAVEALAELGRNRRIDILFTDVNMPGMGGYELADLARRAGVQVILLSGRETEARGFPLVRKPFLEADLKRTMEHSAGLC